MFVTAEHFRFSTQTAGKASGWNPETEQGRAFGTAPKERMVNSYRSHMPKMLFPQPARLHNAKVKRYKHNKRFLEIRETGESAEHIQGYFGTVTHLHIEPNDLGALNQPVLPE